MTGAPSAQLNDLVLQPRDLRPQLVVLGEKRGRGAPQSSTKVCVFIAQSGDLGGFPLTVSCLISGT
jgi:hypothetical protein